VDPRPAGTPKHYRLAIYDETTPLASDARRARRCGPRGPFAVRPHEPAAAAVRAAPRCLVQRGAVAVALRAPLHASGMRPKMSIVTSLVLFSLSPRSTLGPTQPSCLCQLRLASTLMNLGTALGGPAASSANSQATLAMAARRFLHHAVAISASCPGISNLARRRDPDANQRGRPHRVDGLRPLRCADGYLARVLVRQRARSSPIRVVLDPHAEPTQISLTGSSRPPPVEGRPRPARGMPRWRASGQIPNGPRGYGRSA